jgi:pimeloyl-ACP methyl ester carboxylesterase
MIAPDGTVYEIAGNGPAVVLVHGLGLNRQMWQWLMPDLGGFTVLSYDLIGHGQSPDPQGEPDLRMFGEQVLGLIDHCGIVRCAVVGFSLGGMIARRFAIDHPDRLTALAILASAHGRTEKERAAILVRVEMARHSGPAATIEAALERWFTAPYRNANPEVMEQVRRWVLANRPDVYPAIYQVMAEGDAELREPICAIRCPTLVMTGDADSGSPPAMARRMAEAIPGAAAVVLPGLRHMGLAENPTQFNDPLIDFLNGALLST